MSLSPAEKSEFRIVSLILCLEFSILNFQFSIAFWPEAKSSASIIGRTCAFDAKIYKIVGGFFAVSACMSRAKKYFKFPIFVFNYHRFWSKIRQK